MADWNIKTDKEKMEWYQEEWKKENPNYKICNLEFIKTKEHPEGEWVLKVKGADWAETTSATLKKLKDANYLWSKRNKADFVKKQSLHLNIQVPFFKSLEKKEFKSVSTSLEKDYYKRVEAFCEEHKMKIGTLIKILLKKVVE